MQSDSPPAAIVERQLEDESGAMRIAIVGPGAIGSTYAYKLSRAGHEVTVIARGERLARLERDRAITLRSGERASVDVNAALDPSIAWDIVLVTVLAPQVAAIMPQLRSSSARTIMFMFNTFESIEPLRESVGAERAAFGFPQGVFSLLVDGKIDPQIRGGSVSSDADWAKCLSDAGIPTAVEGDMQSWLRSHAALVIPLMCVGTIAFARGRGVTWREAVMHAAAFETGFAVVRSVGSDVRPSLFALLYRTPRAFRAGLLWLLSRTRMERDLGALGAAEPRMLIDMMNAVAPSIAAPLGAIRP